MNRKYTTETVRKHLESERYRLNGPYQSTGKRIPVTCPRGHDYEVTYSNFLAGYRCGRCARNQPPDITEVRSYFEERGYGLTTTKYVNAHTKLETVCPVGHKYEVSFNSFKQGTRCSKCSSSKGEYLVSRILEKLIGDGSYEYQRRETHKGSKYYYDFFIEPNVYIEYDGVQHYEPKDHFGGEAGFRYTRKRDKEKTDHVNRLGGKLIRIPYTLSGPQIFEKLKQELRGEVPIDESVTYEGVEYNPIGVNHREIADYYMNHSLKDTAEEFGVSRSFPVACFRDIYGMSKTDYYLQETGKPIKGYTFEEIAKYYLTHTMAETANKFDVSVSMAAKAFREVYGISKGEYLKREREE